MSNEAHVRIDEGIERGPYKAPAKWPERLGPIAGKLGKNFKPHDVLRRYLQGEEIADIAKSLNVHPKALNYHLLKEGIREQWREAQVAVSLAELQEAKQVVRDSPDALSLARAREQLRSAQWDLERLETRLFSQKQEIVIDHRVSIDTALQDSARSLLDKVRGRVIDVESTD